MIGFIYIMSNPSHPGVVKIGQSSKDPNERRKELGTTGVLEEFVLEYRALTENYVSLEKEIHRRLASVRVRKDREFFKISVPDAIAKIREIAGNRIESDKIYWVSEEEIQKIKDEKQRKTQETLNAFLKIQAEIEKKKKLEEEKETKRKLKEREREFAAKEKIRKKQAEEWQKQSEAEQEKIRKHNRLDRKLIRAILSILKIIFYPYLLLWKLAGSDSFFLGLLGVLGVFPVAALYIFVYDSIF